MMDLPPEVEQLVERIHEWVNERPFERWFLVKREGENFTAEFGKSPRGEATSFPKEHE